MAVDMVMPDRAVVQATEETVSDLRLRRLYLYWASKTRPGHLPMRRDIDPCEIKPLLPHVMMTDVPPDGRLRYRLVGTGIVQNVGWDPTGRLLSEVLPETGGYRDHVFDLYQRLLDTRRPVVSRSEYLTSLSDLARVTERVMMPLVDARGSITMVFSGQIFWSLSETPLGLFDAPGIRTADIQVL